MIKKYIEKAMEQMRVAHLLEETIAPNL